jgi:hypothetical protein
LPHLYQLEELMIVFTKPDGELEFPISFDELRARFPHTSFPQPLMQSALPAGYHLFQHDDCPVVNNKKSVAFFRIDEMGFPKIGWKLEDYSQEEWAEAEHKVELEIERLAKEVSWCFADDVPDKIKNKYKEYRKKLWDIINQDGYPFNVKYPEA